MGTLYVFIGGGLGAICRYAISKFFGLSANGFPVGTFIANVISCIILGMLMGWLFKKGMDQKMQLLLMTGFCGGFSTFSTFSAETFQLIENGNTGLALLYIVTSVVVCTLLLFGGYFLMKG